MALALDDFYLILSDGMYAGSVAETTITATKRYTRLLSHGLLETAPAPVVSVLDLFKFGSGYIRRLRQRFSRRR